MTLLSWHISDASVFESRLYVMSSRKTQLMEGQNKALISDQTPHVLRSI